MYIDNIHRKNIELIHTVADRVNDGEDLYYVLFDEGVTDVGAIITDDELDIIEYGFFEEVEDTELEGYYEGISVEQSVIEGDVSYQVIKDDVGDSQFTIYYMELEDGNFLVIEHYLAGLVNANEVLNQIDLYVILGMILFLLPYTYWYSRRFSRPLQAMNRQVNALSNLEFLAPLRVRSKDEVGQLTESINMVSVSLESAINKLQEDIEFEKYKDKKRRELIASLSHELKTPITTLRAVIEGMRDNIGKYSNRDEYLKESLEYLLYMETLSKDIIDAINIESKKIVEESYDLLEIYEESLRFVAQPIKQKNQTIESTLTSCSVSVNKGMILRVFINVLSNASLYSEKGEKIIISSKVLKDEVEVSILNTGAYIKPGDITHLFDPFYRVEKSRNKETGGSGLGLFIIKSILDGHNSTYSIINDVEGVKFTFTLKLTQF